MVAERRVALRRECGEERQAHVVRVEVDCHYKFQQHRDRVRGERRRMSYYP